MTQDEIIRIAREAGFGWHTPSEQVIVRHSNGSWIGIEEQLERFAALVAAEKDKEIAELYAMCLKQAKTIKEHQDAAIRARGDA